MSPAQSGVLEIGAVERNIVRNAIDDHATPARLGHPNTANEDALSMDVAEIASDLLRVKPRRPGAIRRVADGRVLRHRPRVLDFIGHAGQQVIDPRQHIGNNAWIIRRHIEAFFRVVLDVVQLRILQRKIPSPAIWNGYPRRRIS